SHFVGSSNSRDATFGYLSANSAPVLRRKLSSASYRASRASRILVPAYKELPRRGFEHRIEDHAFRIGLHHQQRLDGETREARTLLLLLAHPDADIGEARLEDADALLDVPR